MHYSSLFNTKLYGSILTGTFLDGPGVKCRWGMRTTAISTYCNAVLAGLPKVTIAPLQRAQNASARLILRLASHDHVTTALRHLHWLPVQYRITNKLCLPMHLIHIHKAPCILSQRHCHSDSISQFSWTASVHQQLPLRAATDETQIWSALFLICCTSRLEHSTAITATTH